MDLIASWLGNTPDFAVPFALAALGLIITERAGVLSLGAEGLMLVGALAGIGAQLAYGSAELSLLIAMLSASVVSILFAIMVVLLRINQVIAGLSLVFFCQGLTGLLGTLWGWTNRPVSGMSSISLWPLSELPLIGKVFVQNPVVYLTPLIFLAVVWFLTRSGTGLRLRAVGENPQAADSVGIPVLWYRVAAILAGAALIGLAGGYLSVLSTKLWIADMTGGRGWIAIALVIFARWYPWRALMGALLFGCVEALIPQLAAAGIRLPQYFILMTPYAVTLGVMIWVAASKRAGGEQPGALGIPFVREERR
ncbi:ABC transporter permease [Alkalilimnicola ehrlichii]|uniref:ABC transporter permease n=1 Tax=Alkalilimnicola ehrlichii TaxID=351052 RepID=A0A3E0WZD6_9GAMM|nr:ABC transporter permease [Alkalilimnicola ehrlichii]RFA30817.1 ABC transporter permease [Alkalilimnicola ehrlichii]RFA38396.1 ABC transporter permease [Alkalilimnicola ehrlichii]